MLTAVVGRVAEENKRLRQAGDAMAARLRGWPEEVAWQKIAGSYQRERRP